MHLPVVVEVVAVVAVLPQAAARNVLLALAEPLHACTPTTLEAKSKENLKVLGAAHACIAGPLCALCESHVCEPTSANRAAHACNAGL